MVLAKIVARRVGDTDLELNAKRRSVAPGPAIVRALPPTPDFSTFFPVTPIDLDLTNVSMLYKMAKISGKHAPWQPLAMKSKFMVHLNQFNGLESINTWKS